MKLRDYQAWAIAEIFRYFEQSQGNPIIALPTGTGKSVIIAGFIAEVFKRYRGQRIMKAAHVQELIEQNFSKLLELWPTAPAGIYSAGLKRRDAQTPIVYAGIASAVKAAELFGHIDLVIVDECHLVSPKEGTMYQKMLAVLRAVNPALKVIGFTATHYRLGQGPLTEDGGIFTDIAVDLTTFKAFNWFLDDGFLCPLVPRPTRTILDVSSVKVQQGDYNQKELQVAVDREEITRAALSETLEWANGRRHWLVFAAGIEHTEHVAEMLNHMGVPATFVHTGVSAKDRKQRLDDYKAGRYVAMVNNGILTTGFDFPGIDLIIVLRPTQSPGLWVQMLGRGTRPVYVLGFDLETKEGRLASIANSAKRNCLVLDFAGNTRRLGPINDPVKPRKRGKGRGQAPVRICEGCGIYCHASARVCPECGFVFTIKTKISANAATDELIKRDDLPELVEFPVNRVVYSEHRRSKGQGLASLKVSYHCGLRVFHEWVCFEHEGYAKHRAHDWWRENPTTEKRCPATVYESYQRLNELSPPKKVLVWANREYPEVRGREY